VYTYVYICILIYICIYDYLFIRTYNDAYTYTFLYAHIQTYTWSSVLSPWLLKIIGLFCKRALWKRRYSAKETYNFNTYKHTHDHLSDLLHNTIQIYVWIDIYIYIHIYIYLHIFIHNHVYTYIYAYTSIYRQILIYIHTYIYIHIHSYLYMYMYMYIYRQILINIHTYIYIQIYSYLYINVFIRIIIYPISFTTPPHNAARTHHSQVCHAARILGNLCLISVRNYRIFFKSQCCSHFIKNIVTNCLLRRLSALRGGIILQHFSKGNSKAIWYSKFRCELTFENLLQRRSISGEKNSPKWVCSHGIY